MIAELLVIGGLLGLFTWGWIKKWKHREQYNPSNYI